MKPCKERTKVAIANVNQALHDTNWNEIQTCEAIDTYWIFWKKNNNNNTT